MAKDHLRDPVYMDIWYSSEHEVAYNMDDVVNWIITTGNTGCMYVLARELKKPDIVKKLEDAFEDVMLYGRGWSHELPGAIGLENLTLFARDVKGANVERLENIMVAYMERVIATFKKTFEKKGFFNKDAFISAMQPYVTDVAIFATYVPGANIDRLRGFVESFADKETIKEFDLVLKGESKDVTASFLYKGKTNDTKPL